MNAVALVFFMFFGFVGLVFSVLLGATVHPLVGMFFFLFWGFCDFVLASAIRVLAQWERGVVFRLGRFSGIKGPGLFFIIPVFDQVRTIDTRVLTMDIPRQQVITKDNVPVMINGVLFYNVADPAKAVIEVQNFSFAVAQYAQTALRDVIGQMTLDEILVEREQIGVAIEKSVESASKSWGLNVDSIRIQDIDMPEDLKKMMSRQASAEREKRANITKSEGDRDAARNLAEAARVMSASPGAMQLRSLQTIDGLGPTASNTVVLAIPLEIMELAQTVKEALEGQKKEPHDS